MTVRRTVFIGLAVLTIVTLAYFNYTDKISTLQTASSIETVTNSKDTLINE